MPKQQVKSKEDTKTDVQVKPVVPYAPTYEEPKPCTTAKIVGGDVARGDRLTILESQNHVKFGGDVMCDNRSSALSVAMAFPFRYEDTIQIDGVKNSNDWHLNVHVSDIYDFTEYRTGGGFSNFANNSGYRLQKSGLLTPYTWDVDFEMNY